MSDWNALFIMNKLFSVQFVHSLYNRGLGRFFYLGGTALLIFIFIPSLAVIGFIINKYGHTFTQGQTWFILALLVYISAVVMYSTIVLDQVKATLSTHYLISSSYGYSQTYPKFRQLFEMFKERLIREGISTENCEQISLKTYFSIISDIHEFEIDVGVNK